MTRLSPARAGHRRAPLSLLALLALPAVGLGCSGDTAPPTAPKFTKGGLPAVTVTSLADDGSAGTLRSVLAAAPTGANVTFADNLCTLGGSCTITLQLQQGFFLTVDKSLQIIGPTGYTLAVDGGGSIGPVLSLPSGSEVVVVKNLTISGGSGVGNPGGIQLSSGATLTLTNSVVSGNTGSGGGAIGGIRLSSATLTLINSVVSGNTASDRGGVGGISASPGSTLTLTNSAVTGNTGDAEGGIGNNNATVTLTNSTVSGNTAITGTTNPAGGGGGLTSNNSASTTTLQKKSCINNNTVGSTTSSTPWDVINIAITNGTVTGLNCGVAQ